MTQFNTDGSQIQTDPARGSGVIWDETAKGRANVEATKPKTTTSVADSRSTEVLEWLRRFHVFIPQLSTFQAFTYRDRAVVRPG